MSHPTHSTGAQQGHAGGSGAPALVLPPGAPLMAIDAEWLNRASAPRGSIFSDLFGGDRLPFQRLGRAAVVDVSGALAQRSSWFWQGYDEIKDTFAQALADRETDGVLLRIDSPGGMCAGCFEAVAEMRQMASEAGKPVVAYADEMAYSAAYAIAAVADVIVLPASGGAGSVGVIAAYVDMSKAYEQMGVRVAVVASGSRKTDSHPAVPLTDAAIERLRSDVMTLAGIFFDHVAKSRGMTVEAVKALQAGTFLGQAAVDVGLADAVGGISEALRRLDEMAASGAYGRDNGASRATENKHMSTKKNEGAAQAAAEPVEGAILQTEAVVPLSAHQAQIDTLNERHEAAMGAVRIELAGAQEREAKATKALAEANAKLAKVESDRIAAKVDALVGVKITKPARDMWLKTAQSDEAHFDALMNELPEIGALGGQVIRERDNGHRASNAEEQNVRRLNELADARAKSTGETRMKALQAVMLEHPELCDSND